MRIFSGFDKVAKLLIQKGADINLVGNYGKTALGYAVQIGKAKMFGHIKITASSYLKLQQSALELISRLLIFIYLFIGFGNIIRILIEKGANVNHSNKDNDSVLIFAAKYGNTYQILYLLFHTLASLSNQS